ncbi:M28 family peptidase [Streptomyces sp. CB03238]|uniref:M28 family peptidase n=1 Tax=Streptomyces sp. CB03238 TaxID=1907777 RepID=UPI0024096615|nr:M28 family peptidase [Streptomyces sp. CB03238]
MLPTHIPEVVRELTRRADPQRLRQDVEFLADRPRSRTRAPEAMLRAEAYVTTELTAAGWRTWRQPFDVWWRLGSTDRRGHQALPLEFRLHPRLTGANLLAEPPVGPHRPIVVVGAHLDTVDGSPGADDNASGVAALLETARLLGGLPGAPDVTFMVFDMEELGLIGSRFAAQWIRRNRNVMGMICLESVGYFTTEPGSQQMPMGFGTAFPRVAAEVRSAGLRGDFTLVVHRRSTRAAAALWRGAAQATEPVLSCVALCDPRPLGPLGALAGLVVPPLAHLDRSDHAAFWNTGTPALMLTDTANFRNPHYHQPTDTPGSLDYRRLAAIAVATAATAASWPDRKRTKLPSPHVRE